MAVRLKTRWHRSKRSDRNRKGSSEEKSLEDLSGVVAFNIWKLAKEAFLRMEKENFRFREDTQAIDVVSELCIFMLHIVDRMIYDNVPEEFNLSNDDIIPMGEYNFTNVEINVSSPRGLPLALLS